MLDSTVKGSSASPIPGKYDMDDAISQRNSGSPSLTSEIDCVGNNTQALFIQPKASISLSERFLTHVWRCVQASYGKYSNGNISDEKDAGLQEILIRGETLRQQAHSLSVPCSETSIPQSWKGSLLKRCLVGAGLLTGTSMLGGAVYAGYHYNSRTSNSDTPGATKTLENYGGGPGDPFDYHALHHDTPTNRIRHHRRHLPVSTYNPIESHLSDNGWKNTFHNILKKTNRRVIKLLYREGLLPNRKEKYKEKMLSAVSQYIYDDGNIEIENEDKIKILVQKLLFASGIYGEKKNEEITNQRAKSVFRYWVFQNIIGTMPEKYIENEIKKDKSKNYTINDIHRLLPVDTLPTMNNFRPDRLTPSEKSFLSALWKKRLLEDMPFLAFSDKRVQSISLNDFAFANLYSGSRFLKDIQGEELSSENIISMGDSIWELATIDNIPEDKLVYYRAPAILFYAASPESDKNESMNDIDLINNYLDYREKISSAEEDVNAKYNTYHSAVASWLTKGSLADKIIEECRPNIKSDIFNTTSVRRVAKQNYLDNFMKPCDSAPDKLDDKYSQLTTHVSNSFHQIDKYLILPALSMLPTDEQAFISSPKSIMHLGKILVNSSYIARLTQNGNPNIEINTPLNRTIIFSVQQDHQERIYALKETQSNQEYYKLIRVDRVMNNYLQNDILDANSINKFEPPRIFSFFKHSKLLYDLFFSIDRYSFDELFKIEKKPITVEYDNIKSLVDSLSEIHRITLFDELYKLGNEYSDLQKTWHVVKHFIPFYDCTNSIIEKNIVASTFECALDAVSLIPLLGQAAKLSVKFSAGLTQGLHREMLSVGKQGIKITGKNILRDIHLPTAVELSSLGKEALRVADPGFELIKNIAGIANRKFAEKIVRLISSNKKNVNLEKYIDLRITHLPQATSRTQVVGILQGTELEVPIKAIGKQKGKKIYAKENPETGEIYGTKYYCIKNGILAPVSSLFTIAAKKNNFSNKNPHISQIKNIAPDDIRRVKRAGRKRNLCSDQPSTSKAIKKNITPENKISDINIIAPQMNFLPPSLTSTLKVKPINKTPIKQPNLLHDMSPISKKIKKNIYRLYAKDSVFLYRFNEDIGTIPDTYSQLIHDIPEYTAAVSLAKKYVNDLDSHFKFIEIQQADSLLQPNPHLLKIENYLSKKMKLDTIADANTVSIIKQEAISRLKFHIRHMNDYFNNEIDNIYFASANIKPCDYITKNRRVFAFTFPEDARKRVIIMADYFSPAEISTKLHTTLLHEVSHLSGTYDFSVNRRFDIVSAIENFNNAALGVNNQYINFDKSFLNHYKSSTHFNVNAEQLKEIIKKDPVLRANMFIENADFLADTIADLATLSHYGDDVLDMIDTSPLT